MQVPPEQFSQDNYLQMDLLRFTTAGSVDDGKSTLIGRLLYDSKSIFEDQLEAIEHSSRLRGEETVNLALLTDGLRAEREQGITIDVAYRYFATPKRKFIIADTPGHVQYTRNMVTGASTADLAIILVDARKGVLEQSKRHGFISTLLQIRHLIVAVNKMDLVGYAEDVFTRIVADYTAFARKLNVHDLVFIPVSALLGDNVVDKSEAMPWYNGPTLMHHLENVSISSDRNLIDFRFPVQYVVRPNQDFRGFAGRIASGTIRPGEEVMVLPSGRTSRVRSIVTLEREHEEAQAGESVTITLEDEVDVSRGDMIVRRRNLPHVGRRLDAMLCWMSEAALQTGKAYFVQQTTRTVKAFFTNVVYRIDIDTLHREQATTLGLNDIGRVEVETAQPLFFDAYDTNLDTGSFVVIDPDTNNTVGAGMIRGPLRDVLDRDVLDEDEAADGAATMRARRARRSPDVVWEGENVSLAAREQRNGHRAAVVWFTGLSGAGKTTIARRLEQRLFEDGLLAMLLDGDHVRHGLCGDLGFTEEDRKENIRRVGEVARYLFEQGAVVLCTFVSPYARDRGFVRDLLPEGRFYEVHVAAPLDVVEARDPKGLYRRARAGEIAGFTGIDAPYEAPTSPELTIATDRMTVDEAVDLLLERLRADGIL